MSHCAVCCNKHLPNGCQVPVVSQSGSAISCGETQTLDIFSEIRQEFQDKMNQIDAEAGGDCLSGLQAKLHLQQEWIQSLTVQNEMLVEAVKELETEATKKALEEKLENSTQLGSENSLEKASIKALEDEVYSPTSDTLKTDGSNNSGNSQGSIQKSIEQKSSDDNNASVISKKVSDASVHQERIKELEQELEKALQESENERTKRSQEINNLKETIFELEKALQHAQAQVEHLQKRVDLFENSVNVLEASEERSKIEKSQQFTTIVNLQEALVSAKHLIDNLQFKTNNEVSSSKVSKWFGLSSVATKSWNVNKPVHDI